MVKKTYTVVPLMAVEASGLFISHLGNNKYKTHVRVTVNHQRSSASQSSPSKGLHLQKLALPTGDQVLKHMSLRWMVHTQTITFCLWALLVHGHLRMQNLLDLISKALIIIKF